MAQRGSNRGRLLLVSLLVTSLLLITLDLRGVSVIGGIRSGTQTVLAPIQRFTSDLFSPVGNFLSDVAHLGRTRSQINTLKSENEKLKEELVNAQDAQGKYTQLKSVLDLAGRAQWNVVSARVIAHGATSTFSQTITIDAGSSSGIARDMSVVSGAGLVGVVKSVTARSAVVLLMSDPSFRIGVRIAGSQVMGVLSGTGGRSYSLQLLDATENVNLGDVLVARGSDNDRPFPPGVPVGTVSWVDNATGQLTKHANVEGFAKLTSVGVVSVILSTTSSDPHDSLVPAKPKPTPIPTVTVTASPSPSKS